MNISPNYGFYLPSRDADDIVDINQLSENFVKIDDEMSNISENKSVDQSYNPQSENAQSGKAVAEALADKMDKFGEVENSTEQGGTTRINMPEPCFQMDICNGSVLIDITPTYLGYFINDEFCFALSTSPERVFSIYASLDMEKNRIKNVFCDNNSNNTDAVNKGYVDDFIVATEQHIFEILRENYVSKEQLDNAIGEALEGDY